MPHRRSTITARTLPWLALALGACIELPDQLPAARFDAAIDGATGAGGTGGHGGAPDEQPPLDAAVDARPADAAAAAETCNDRDDDYDGLVDEGVRNNCGACGPIPDEICDGFDNDCDLVIDEAAECRCGPGVEEACGTDEGACEIGIRICAPEGSWGPCSGTRPTPEVCNDIDDDCDGDTDEGVRNACGRCGPLPEEICNGVDDDCDGFEDGRAAPFDACACQPGTNEACGSDVGACRPGNRRCDFDGWSDCAGGVAPAAERCNQADDDCDGTIDEGVCACAMGETEACGSDVGACRRGERSCVNGAWGPCMGGRQPVAEACDRADDDCDGAVDEDACECPLDSTRGCGSNEGACRAGTQTCGPQGWGPCQGAVVAEPEACDGVDNDCDGRADEAWPALGDACAAGVGACRDTGTVVCNGAAGTRCDAAAGMPRVEICNGADDDCDGSTDEGTGGNACDTGEDGVCGPGTQTCAGGALRCDRRVGPGAESCDGEDDDCDGRTDEGTGGAQCDSGQPGRCGPGTQACVGGALACQANRGPSNEGCNGIDDDCDGAIDEPPVLLPAECDTGGQGACAEGTPACQNGDTVCLMPRVGAESCNGVDDDCDGRTDEDTGGAPCLTGLQGICSNGREACIGGALQCPPSNPARYEGDPDSGTCNGLDDDCDGATDEDHPRLRQCERGEADYYCVAGGPRACLGMPGPEPIPQ